MRYKPRQSAHSAAKGPVQPPAVQDNDARNRESQRNMQRMRNAEARTRARSTLTRKISVT